MNTTDLRKKKQRDIKIIIMIIISVIALIIIVAVGMNKQKTNELPEKEDGSIWGDKYLGIDANVDKDLQNYRNFVIYGVDNNGKSDIINVFSLNKKTGEVRIVAINRDAYLECRKGRFHKANRGYDWGGIDQGLWELNYNLDLNCREAVAMDWSTVEKLVDAVGGIRVTIDNSVTLEYVNVGMSTYLKYANRSNEYGENRISSTGTYTLNGVQAVGYCRARKDADSFKRAQRNVAVLKQIFAKAKKMNGTDLTKIYESLEDKIETNMSKNKLVDTLQEVVKGNISDSYIWPNKYETWWGAYYYYVPITLESEVKELHENMFDQNNYTPSDTVKNISKDIQEDLKDGTLHRQ